MIREEISDWAEVVARQLLLQRLGGRRRPTRVYFSEPQETYEVLVVLALRIGVFLRPDPAAVGPVGADAWKGSIRTIVPLREFANAARLIGAGAQGDSGLCSALALAIVNAPDFDTVSWQVGTAMLEIYAVTPRPTPTPEGPHDGQH